MAFNVKNGILIAEDLASDRHAQTRATAVRLSAEGLARRLGMKSLRLHVEEPISPAFTGGLPNPLRKLTRLGDRTAGVELLEGQAVPQLLNKARKSGAAILAVGTHGRKGISRMLLGSVAEELIRRSGIPVLCLGPKASGGVKAGWPGENPLLVVGTALNRQSAPAEAQALALAKKLQGSLLFVHSFSDSLHPVLQTAFQMPSLPAELSDLSRSEKKKARTALEARVKAAKAKGVKADFVLEERFLSASDLLVREAARRKATLLVLGTHGRSLLEGAFLGRTLRDVILNATVPVLSVGSRRGG